MAAVIDLRAPDTVTRQTISSRTSIILNSLPLSSPLSLPADLNIYSQVFIHKPAFMCKRSATQAAIPGKISSLIWKGEWLWQLYSRAFHSSSCSLSSSVSPLSLPPSLFNSLSLPLCHLLLQAPVKGHKAVDWETSNPQEAQISPQTVGYKGSAQNAKSPQ